MSTARALKAISGDISVYNVVIRRPGFGPGTFNETTLVRTPAYPTEMYRGKAGFGARRTGQRRDSAFADRREEVGMLRLPLDHDDVDLPTVDDEIEWLEGPMVGQLWLISGGFESSWRATKRFSIRRVLSEVAEA